MAEEDVCSHRLCRDCETNKSPPPLPPQVFSFILFSFILVFFQALVLKELKALRKISRNCVYKAAFYVSSSSNLIHFFYFFLIRNLLFILVIKASTFYSFIKVITFLFPYPILRDHRWGLTDEILHKGIFSFPTQLAHLFLCMSRS